MSIWTLASFALCMLSAVLGCRGEPTVADLGLVAFVGTLVVFLISLWIGGIRKPVV